MPRFHFTLRNSEVKLDPEGSELPDVRDAQVEAARFAAEELGRKPERIWADGLLEITISDHNGKDLGMVSIIATRSSLSSEAE